MSAPLPLEHIALQLAFARRVAEVTEMPPDDALRFYTTSYSAAGLRPSLNLDSDPAAPEWQAFLQGFHAAVDQTAFFHAAHLATWEKRNREKPPRPECFGYRYNEETRTAQMQFGSNDPQGPLSRERIPARVAELQAMTAEIAVEHPEAERVIGRSWLYNLPAYCRLLPPAFVAAPQIVPGEYSVISSWGPFLDRHGAVKADLAATFHACIAEANTLDALLACFPFPVLAVECDIAHFYAHYGVAPPVSRS